VTRLPRYPATLWALLADRAAKTPDRVLIDDDRGRSLTAGRWLAESERVAAGLSDLGVGEGTLVSWQLPTVIAAPVLMMALVRLGAVQNPIIPVLRRREVGFITAQTGAEWLITPGVWRGFDHSAMAADIAADRHLHVLTVGEYGLPVGEPDTLPPRPTGAGSPVRHVYYTSGSTADPKGARHTDASVMHATTGLIVGIGLRSDDCMPLPFPVTHIGGMTASVVSLWTGCRLQLIETFDPMLTPTVMAAGGATILGSALPFFLAYREAQRRHGPQALFPRLRGFLSGGAPKPAELFGEMEELFGVPTLSSWGLTEFPIATACTEDDSDADLASSEGRVVPGVQLRVVGADGGEAPAGLEGELRLKGPQMFRGYVDSALDRDAFDELGFFRTGDLGVVGPRGHVRITGRIKDVIIRNAENISAQEIEDILYAHPAIADAAVIGLPNPRTGEQVCAVLALAYGVDPLTVSDVARFCRSQQLATHKLPERVEIVDELPRNALGKVLKQQLRTRYSTPDP
jgi:acyl-CoA synthetase (AMP-forming)/AMP-acid ligase II